MTDQTIIWVKRELLSPIVQGQKTIEIRPSQPIFAKIKVGEVVLFNEKVSKRVAAIRHYKDVFTLLAEENAGKILPQRSAEEILEILKGIYRAKQLYRTWIVFEIE